MRRVVERSQSIQSMPPASEFVYESTDAACSQPYLWPVVSQLLCDLPAGSRVVDLGCGNGAMMAALRGRGWELVGVDASASGITLARRTWQGVRFEQADVTENLLHLGEFDAVLSTEVIEHLYSPRRFIWNCYGLLRPGGTLVISTPYHGWLKNVLIALAGHMDAHLNPLWDHGHIKMWSQKTMGSILAEAGFQELEFAGAGRLPYLWKSMVVRAKRPLTAELGPR